MYLELGEFRGEMGRILRRWDCYAMGLGFILRVMYSLRSTSRCSKLGKALHFLSDHLDPSLIRGIELQNPLAEKLWPARNHNKDMEHRSHQHDGCEILLYLQKHYAITSWFTDI